MQEGGLNDKEREIPAQFFINIDKPKSKKTRSDFETINLKETGTFVLFNTIATCVSNEDENLAKVKENNQKYVEVSFNSISKAINTKKVFYFVVNNFIITDCFDLEKKVNINFRVNSINRISVYFMIYK